MMAYHLISALDAQTLTRMVNAKLTEGWRLYGDPLAVKQTVGFMFAQAVVLQDDEPEPLPARREIMPDSP